MFLSPTVSFGPRRRIQSAVEIIGRTFANDREEQRRVGHRVSHITYLLSHHRTNLLSHHRANRSLNRSLIHRGNPLTRSTTSFTLPERPQIYNSLLTNLEEANTDEDDLIALRGTLSKPAFCQFLDMNHE
jgi:hypothetical protein